MGLVLTNKAVKRALEHPQLQGKAPIGRGKYTLVFDGASDSVLKLTVDQSQVELARWVKDACLELHHFPKFLGVVSEFGDRADRMWLIEAERLNKLVAGTPQRKKALSLKRLQHGINGKAIAENYYRVAELTCRYMSQSSELESEWQKTFGALASYAAGRHYLGCDFHPANFLTRPATGELVLNDPFEQRTH